MKTIALFALLIPFSLLAQSDDYCPCQDDLNNQAEIFDFVSSINPEQFIRIPQNTVNVLMPVVIQEDKPIDIVLPEEKIIEQKEEEPVEEKLSEIDREELKAEIQARNEAREARFKRVKKRTKTRVKRHKRVKKYKGKCPFF